jgi:RHS repeat-associated protein
VLTDGSGTVQERLSYDAWGKRRNANGSDNTTCSITSATSRGFTGHEMMDSVCLINTNARVYDPSIGRFMSADSIVPDPLNSQSFNRYSYVNDMALSATDPTGHAYDCPHCLPVSDPFDPCFGCSGPGMDQGAVIGTGSSSGNSGGSGGGSFGGDTSGGSTSDGSSSDDTGDANDTGDASDTGESGVNTGSGDVGSSADAGYSGYGATSQTAIGTTTEFFQGQQIISASGTTDFSGDNNTGNTGGVQIDANTPSDSLGELENEWITSGYGSQRDLDRMKQEATNNAANKMLKKSIVIGAGGIAVTGIVKNPGLARAAIDSAIAAVDGAYAAVSFPSEVREEYQNLIIQQMNEADSIENSKELEQNGQSVCSGGLCFDK